MRSIKVDELRHHLARYLAAARRGERLVVMDRRTPIAEIGPATSRSATETSARAELIRLGVLLPARKGRSPREMRREPIKCRGDVLKVLRAERDAI